VIDIQVPEAYEVSIARSERLDPNCLFDWNRNTKNPLLEAKKDSCPCILDIQDFEIHLSIDTKLDHSPVNYQPGISPER
jgi:hypothetical protein